MVFRSQTHFFCSNLIFQNEEFSNFSVCPLSVRKIGAQLYLPDPRINYAVALEKPAVKPVARLQISLQVANQVKFLLVSNLLGV